METFAFALGSHPGLSAVEIAAYVRRHNIRADFDLSALPAALLVRIERELKPREILNALGGTPYIARVRASVPELSVDALRRVLETASLPARGKYAIGLSLADPLKRLHMTTRDLRALGLALKKQMKKPGLRFLFPQGGSTALSTAQMLHAHLPKRGLGVICIPTNDGNISVSQLEAVQDIQRYTMLDRDRPDVDPGSGMLPLKVAQMLLNLSLVPEGGTIYDPFSGSGTIPFVALMSGHPVVASDVSPRQAARTKENIAWLRSISESRLPDAKVFVHDVARYVPHVPARSIAAVVTEGTLGRSRTQAPSPREADKVFAQVQTVLNAALTHLSPALVSGARIILTIPAFRMEKRIVRASWLALGPKKQGAFPPRLFVQEPLVPEGWDHELFRGSSGGTLLYGRPDALVLREIVRLQYAQ